LPWCISFAAEYALKGAEQYRDRSNAGAANWGVIASLIETCKLNAVDPHAYLSDMLTAIVNGHKQSDIDALLPWNYAQQSAN